jgi:thioesterase domain-containing protein
MRIEQGASLAAQNYQPSAIKANVLLFVSEVRATGKIMGRDLGWEAVLKRPVHLNFVPGNHNEILHPSSAAVMANLVREELGLKSEVTL